MPDELPEHFAVVGPAWLDFERAVRAAGAVGEDLAAQLDSLRARLSPATLDIAHQLRRQRNALFHDGTLIRDLRGWEAQCRRTIAELRSPVASRMQRGRSAGRATQTARGRGPILGISIVAALAALAGLGVVAFAWFEAGELCGSATDRLGCTFDASAYMMPALAAVAVVAIAGIPVVLRRSRR